MILLHLANKNNKNKVNYTTTTQLATKLVNQEINDAIFEVRDVVKQYLTISIR